MSRRIPKKGTNTLGSNASRSNTRGAASIVGMDLPSSRLPARALGKRLREIREALNISQHDLSELAHVDPSNIGKIERGQANPKLDTVTRIATALDTSVSDLTRYVTAEHVAPIERRITAADLIRAREEQLRERDAQ